MEVTRGSSIKKRKRSYFCDHRQQEHSKTLYYQHRRIYDNKFSKQEEVAVSDLGDDFNFEQSDAEVHTPGITDFVLWIPASAYSQTAKSLPST